MLKYLKLADKVFDLADETEDAKVTAFIEDCRSDGAASGDGIQAFEQGMAAKLDDEDGVAFDPTIILTILSVLIPMIAKCFEASPVTVRQRTGRRLRLALAIRRAHEQG